LHDVLAHGIATISVQAGVAAHVLHDRPAHAEQARRVARLIPNFSPTIAPIQPQVQNAVGQHNEIVVIFD
jgi:hypothetical protein